MRLRPLRYVRRMPLSSVKGGSKERVHADAAAPHVKAPPGESRPSLPKRARRGFPRRHLPYMNRSHLSIPL